MIYQIKPEIFEDKEFNPTDFYGVLRYPGLFKWLVYRIVSVKTSENHGALCECQILNAEILKEKSNVKGVEYSGTIKIRSDDLIEYK